MRSRSRSPRSWGRARFVSTRSIPAWSNRKGRMPWESWRVISARTWKRKRRWAGSASRTTSRRRWSSSRHRNRRGSPGKRSTYLAAFVRSLRTSHSHLNEGEPAMKIKRKGSAAWQGGLKDGKGTISTESGALKAYPYGFAARFEGQRGSNPEELIAAAHASCFTMALSLILGEAKLTAEQMDTSAEVTLEKVGEGFSITAVHLTLKAKVPGADDATFQSLAAKAKA